MKLWLDDIRPAPEGWTWIKDAWHAIALLAELCTISHSSDIEISLDHDLGDDKNGTGYDVAKSIESGAHSGTIPRIKWNVHSANPVGRKNMIAALESADRAWKELEEKVEDWKKLDE